MAARLAAPFGRNPANMHGCSAVQGAGRSTAQLTVSMISRHTHTKKAPGARPGDRRPDARADAQPTVPAHSFAVRAACCLPTGRPLVRLPSRGGHQAARPNLQAPKAGRAHPHGLGAAPPGQAAPRLTPCTARALSRTDPSAASGRRAHAGAHPHQSCPMGCCACGQARSRGRRLAVVHSAHRRPTPRRKRPAAPGPL